MLQLSMAQCGRKGNHGLTMCNSRGGRKPAAASLVRVHSLCSRVSCHFQMIGSWNWSKGHNFGQLLQRKNKTFQRQATNSRAFAYFSSGARRRSRLQLTLQSGIDGSPALPYLLSCVTFTHLRVHVHVNGCLRPQTRVVVVPPPASVRLLTPRLHRDAQTDL